jgi:hypothetical protein
MSPSRDALNPAETVGLPQEGRERKTPMRVGVFFKMPGQR